MDAASIAQVDYRVHSPSGKNSCGSDSLADSGSERIFPDGFGRAFFTDLAPACYIKMPFQPEIF